MRRLVPPGQFLQWPVQPDGFRERQVRIYVPSDQRADGTRPLLLLFDGQNVFGDEGSFAGGWHAAEALDAVGRRGRNVPVIVGLDNGGPDRLAELSAWKVEGAVGRVVPFMDWVVGTLLPRVQEAFGLCPGPLGAVVGGSSMGGLAALYAHFHYPQAFGGALALSPSLWVARGQLFGFIQSRPRPPLSRIYLDAGALEGGGRMLPLARRMAEALAKRGYDHDQLHFRADPRGRHNERAWRRRLPHALRFMFRA
jgi:enterochelin esterase-like enzyme